MPGVSINVGATPLPADLATSVEQRNWLKFESKEPGVTFWYPYLPGETAYEYCEAPGLECETGTIVAWNIQRQEDDRTYTPAFAGCVSADFAFGRGGSLTDIIRWLENDGEYFVEVPWDTFQVTPLRIIQHPQGMQGLIFDPNQYWAPYTDPDERLAILNLPEDHRSDVKCLSFRFFRLP